MRFDDTPEQISAQLQSSHAASQLNLGNLSHPKESESSEGRGEGFELRTDQWGAIRAGKGLLISTYRQDSAAGNHLDASRAKEQIESNLDHSKALSDIAEQQQTDPLQFFDSLKQFLSQIEAEDQAKAIAFKQAVMLLTAPQTIALSTNENIHLSADQQINQSAGDNIHFSTQKSLVAHAQDRISLFAAQEGASVYAAKGKIELQAQDDAIEAIARKVIKLISTEDKIEITSPKEIVLTAGGSQIKVNSGGVFFTTGGKFECKAGQHNFMGGAKVSYEIPQLPNNALYSNRLDIYDLFWQSDFSSINYKAFIPDTNSYISGQLDAHGRTGKITTADSSKVEILVGLNDEWGLSVQGYDVDDLIEQNNK